jgi:putative membrane protein
MQVHRPFLAATLLLAGAALAQGTTGGAPSNPPSTNPAPQSSGSMSTPPSMSGTERHPADNQASGQPMTPPTSSALGTTPSPAEMLADLHMANASEIDLGKIAEQRAHDKDVKKYGKRMVKDHTGLDKDAQSWAKKNKVTIGAPPADDAHQAEMKKTQDLKERLQTLSGAEFDKTYMQAMAEDHANDLTKVQTFEQQTTDKSLKKLLEKARKVIASHKKDADKLVQKLGATAAR